MVKGALLVAIVIVALAGCGDDGPEPPETTGEFCVQAEGLERLVASGSPFGQAPGVLQFEQTYGSLLEGGDFSPEARRDFEELATAAETAAELVFDQAEALVGAAPRELEGEGEAFAEILTEARRFAAEVLDVQRRRVAGDLTSEEAEERLDDSFGSVAQLALRGSLVEDALAFVVGVDEECGVDLRALIPI